MPAWPASGTYRRYQIRPRLHGLVALAHNLRKYARVQTLELPNTSEPVVAELPKTHEKVAA